MVRNVKFNTGKLAQDLGVSEVVAKLLVNRGIYNVDMAKEFLGGNVSDFNNPKQMLGMNGAVELKQYNYWRKDTYSRRLRCGWCY